ncbi:Uncharacterised protein [Mannheimia haemolytica]|uniref:Protein export membrane protein SecD/SecF C-terminal domain-containing protein n=1 Tax=Mannheimia haemolytica TaxID=75985 RepID=A0A378N423_MANHA|nr:Uncharacterised protein [Mannheimia haemolytica]
MEMIHQKLDSNATIKSIEFVGPNVGEELTQGAIYATWQHLLCYLFTWKHV